jgi:exopolysaccharide biosynthesis protein
MNKYIRKSLALLFVSAILMASLRINIYAAPSVINQSVTKQNITSGVLLESYNRFTTSGWIKSDVLRADLSNENVKVDGLFNKSSVGSLSTVRNLAKSYGAIAAVNANFFEPKTGDPYGAIMSSGEFAIASTRNDTDMTTFSLDEMNNALFAHWDTKIELIAPNGDRKPIAAYNRYTGYYNYNMYIVDSKWGSKTPGVSSTYPSWTEMVVVDGVVKEFSINKPGIDIPKNGYVVLATYGHEKYLTDNFKVGDPVNYDVTLNVDKSKMKMALTGGTLLVQDGKVVTNFTHSPVSPSTRAARTAVGTSADGKTLIVAAVEGKSSMSIGMTQAELAEYMKELGCANAINFDGGGSTTMVARTAGTTGLSLLNKPSDGSERRVSGSLGIFSIGPKGPVDTLVVSPYENNVFVNTSRAFTARGLDKYLNPVDINQDDIKWSVSGIKGKFKDNTLYPASSGEAVITATLGENVVGTCKINVLSAPVKLELNHSKLNTKANSSTTFTIKGFDKNGFSASIHPSHVKWAVTGTAGKLSSNIFTAGKSGSTGYVSASVAGTSVFCPVSVSNPGMTKIIEDFSSSSMKIEVSSKSVTAKYSRATNVYRSSPYSAKLTYDFTKDLKSNRAAYINLPNGGRYLDSSTSKLGLWVYSSAKKPVWIGAQIYDSKGKAHYEYFTKEISWTGWKYLEVSLSDINSPSKVTKIYAVQPTKVKASGNIYFDNLTMVYTGYPDVSSAKNTTSTVPTDPDYKERSVSGSDSFTFSVFGQSQYYNASKDKTQTAMLKTLAGTINKNVQASVVVGQADDLWSKLKVPVLSTTSGYKAIKNNNSLLLQLKTTTSNSMRLTDSSQWLWFKSELSSYQGNNVFIFLAMNPDNFNDYQEGALLQEVLSNYKKENPGKNVWVFYKGSSNSSYMDHGVKYISTAGFDSPGFSNSKSAAKYVTVKVKGNTVTYQFKSIY